MKIKSLAMVGVLTLGLTGAAVHAQDQRPQRGEGQRQQQRDGQQREARGERGGDRGAWQARMNERMREQLQVSEEEWAVLQPKIDRINQARMGTGMGMMGGMGRGQGGPAGGPGGGRGMGPGADNPVARAAADLRQTLAREDAPASEITQKLTALREARKAAEADMAAAREELRELVTARQEAHLVTMGILD